MFFAATTDITLSGSDYCVYMTKQALDFSITPKWFQVTPKFVILQLNVSLLLMMEIICFFQLETNLI